MAQVEVSYWLNGGNQIVSRDGGLEKIAKLSTNLASFKEYIQLASPDIIFGVGLGSEDNTYYVVLESDSEKRTPLYQAVDELIKQCGVPTRVIRDVDWVVNSILLKYGKKVNDGLSRFLVGKTVVNV